MPLQFVQKDKGGTIYHEVVHAEPSRWDADPAPTVTIYTAYGDTLVASQSATEGPSTTITAAAAAGSQTLALTAVTSVSVDDKMLLGVNSGGQYEWVTVDSVNSSTKAVGLRDKLKYTYASGDAIKSCKLSVALSSSNADAVYESCRAEWAYEVSNQAMLETSIFHISVWSPKMTLRDQDVLVRYPRAEQMLGTRQRLRQLIVDVWERDILEALAMSFNPGALVSGDAMQQAHLYCVLTELATAAQDEDGRNMYQMRYRNAFERALAQTLVDTDGDGAIGSDDVVRSAMTGRIRRSG